MAAASIVESYIGQQELMMKMKYQALLLMLGMLVSGLSFAAGFGSGVVNQIDREHRSITIDGVAFRCTRDVMRSIAADQKPGFIADYSLEPDDQNLIISIRKR